MSSGNLTTAFHFKKILAAVFTGNVIEPLNPQTVDKSHWLAYVYQYHSPSTLVHSQCSHIKALPFLADPKSKFYDTEVSRFTNSVLSTILIAVFVP